MSFVIVLTASKDNFNGMLAAEFSKLYRLRGEWEVSIVSCNVSASDDAESFAWILCNLVDFSYVNDTPTQIIGYNQVGQKQKGGRPLYVKVIKKHFSSINVHLKADLTKEDLLINRDVTCILHFRKA